MTSPNNSLNFMGSVSTIYYIVPQHYYFLSACELGCNGLHPYICPQSTFGHNGPTQGPINLAQLTESPIVKPCDLEII